MSPPANATPEELAAYRARRNEYMKQYMKQYRSTAKGKTLISVKRKARRQAGATIPAAAMIALLAWYDATPDRPWVHAPARQAVAVADSSRYISA